MCSKHWHMFCQWDENGKLDKAREKIGLKPKEPVIYRIVDGQLVRKNSLPPQEATDVSTTAPLTAPKVGAQAPKPASRPTKAKRRGKKRLPRGCL